MNNENNDGFLPGVGPIDNNNNVPNTPQNVDQNITNPNLNEAPFDINQNPNMDPNQFDPNMGQIPFDMGSNPNIDPNQFNSNMGQMPFDMNQNLNMDPNQFESNMNNGYNPSQFDTNMNGGFEQNQFDPSMNNGVEPNQFGPNMGQMPFDMNQNSNIAPNQFDPNMNNGFEQNQFGLNMGQVPFDMNQNPNIAPSQFDPNMNNGFEPNQFGPNMGQMPFDMNQNPSIDPNQFDPNMNNTFSQDQFDPNINGGFEPNQFDPNMNNEFDQTQFNPDMNNNFDQVGSSDYSEDFEKNWMGSIYEKAHSKKFNFCAAFFGPAYLFYRKVYLTGGLTTLILIIVNIILSLLKLTNIGLLLGINVAIMLVYFLGLGFGFYPIYKDFVHKQFNKYKKQIPDNNQLVAVASKKGGTSILALILYYIAMGVVSTVMVTVMFASLMAGIFEKLPQANITGNTITNNTNTTNETDYLPSDESIFEFTEGYLISYPKDSWVVGTDNKSLIKGAYTLSYTVSYQASDLGVSDMTSADGRASILQIINNSVTALATANNLQMDANENFVYSNSAYYTYINLSGDTEITRYYFVLIPSSEPKLFQFELKINDTTIDSDTHLEVTKMLTQIAPKVINSPVDINDPSTWESSSNNTVDNSLSNNTTTDNNSITENNTISNDIATNDVTNNVVSENNTTTGSSISSVLRNTI